MRTNGTLVMGAALLTAIAAACGGETAEDDPSSGGTAGTTSTGGASGTTSTGGTSSGGSSGAASAGGTAGSGTGGGGQGGSVSGGGTSGCPSGGTAGTDAGGAAGSTGATFRVATYNAGLALGYEPYVTERKPLIQGQLSAVAGNLDALCVQEYWEEQDFADLKTAVASDLPHANRPAPVPGPQACTTSELDTLFGCLGQSCGTKSGAELIDCALSSCTTQVLGLQPACLTCVHDQALKSAPPTQVYGACVPGSTGTANETPALFGGNFDIGLLSRLPFEASEVKRLDSAFVRAAVAYGKVDRNGKKLHVFCTHLSSSIGSFPYPIQGGSWQAENKAQAQAVMAYVQQKAGSEAAVLLGDLNTGPALGGLVAEWPDSFGVLETGGFENLFTAQDAACSLCPDNTFRADDSNPKLIDHALVRGTLGASGIGRFMTGLELLKLGSSWVPSHLSDHYGIVAKVEVP